MTALAPAYDRVEDLREQGFTPSQAFDVVGLRWFGSSKPTWADLEHELRETCENEARSG